MNKIIKNILIILLIYVSIMLLMLIDGGFYPWATILVPSVPALLYGIFYLFKN